VISFDIPDLPVRHNFDAKISPYRWAVVFFFILNICAISCMSLSMSPQAELLTSGYGVTTFSVDMCSEIFSATYIPMTFVAMFLYSKLPPQYVLRIACFIFVTGAWFRCLSSVTGTFWPILLGQGWISCAYPLF
jgi:hypothetical protein